MPRTTTAYTTLDLDGLGKQVGFVAIPHSPHDDGWGHVRIPMAVIANGSGPTVILQGGNHGDEYEGPIALGELIRELDPGEIEGRLIVLPAFNAPAVEAGRRVSPVDGLNLNRTYPGDPVGSLTQQITAYASDHLFPIADAFIDLHSGGSSLHMIPSAIVEPAPTREHLARNVAAVRAFGAPMIVVIDNLGDPRTSTATSVRANLTTVGTELGGGGTVSRDALEICRRGLRNLLAHFGVIDGSVSAPTDGDIRAIPGPKGFVFADAAGVFESFHDLGAEVRAGQDAGSVHSLTRPDLPPQILKFGADGIVYGRRQPGRVVPGNCCLVVAAPYEGELP